jgi:phosphonate transport system substrate-binding protein
MTKIFYDHFYNIGLNKSLRVSFFLRFKNLKILLFWSSFLIFSVLFNTACTKKNDELQITYSEHNPLTKKEIHFGIHPLHNPEKLLEVFGPLIDLLNDQIPEFNFKLEASRNYKAFEEKLQKRELEVALPNPYQTILSLKYGYKIFAKMGDDKNFRGLIILRKDSPIKTILDLKNKKISYPAATALAATMMPQYYLYKNGINILKDVKNMYVGSQESSILNAYMKESDAACTWPPPWIAFVKNNPEKASQLEVKWETQSLVNNGLVIRDDLYLQLRDKIRKVLFLLPNSERGRKILQTMELSNFEPADEQTYQSVKEFLDQFSKEIRKPEEEK